MSARNLLLLVALLASTTSVAAAPLIYQGRIEGPPGARVDLRFALYDVEQGGEPVWASDVLDVARDADGRFVAELEDGPDGTIRPHHFTGPRWLQVTVVPRAGDAVPLSPRQRIGWVPSGIEPRLEGRDGDGLFPISVHCGGGPHLADAAERFDDLYTAVRWLDDKRIGVGTTVRIVVRSDCEVGRAIDLTHPQGRQIEIVGDAHGLERPLLLFDGDAFRITAGAEFGLIAHLRLLRSASDGWPQPGNAIEATNGRLRIDDLDIDGFRHGILLRRGSHVTDPTSSADDAIVVRNSESAFVAASYSHLSVDRSVAVNTQGKAYSAEYNSTILAYESRVDGPGSDRHENHAHHAAHASVIYADGSRVSGVGGSAFYASANGFVDADQSDVTDAREAWRAATSGVVHGQRGYSAETPTAAYATRGGYVALSCSPRRGDDAPPPRLPFTAGDGGPAPVVSDTQGMISMPNCDADDVLPEGVRMLEGFIEHPGALRSFSGQLHAHEERLDGLACCDGGR